MLVFVEGGKLENLEKNPRSKARTNNKLNPHMAPERNRTERSRHCAMIPVQTIWRVSQVTSDKANSKVKETAVLRRWGVLQNNLVLSFLVDNVNWPP